MARPRKAAAAKKIHPITFWLEEADYAPLAAAAERAGLRVNELARRLTRRGFRRLVLQVTKRHDPVFVAQLRAIGLNLNQVVKASHMRGYVSPKIHDLCDDIRRMVFTATEAEDQK